jgi:hypothetical protein
MLAIDDAFRLIQPLVRCQNGLLNYGIHGTHGNEDSRKLASLSVCSVCSVVVTNLSLAVRWC